MPNKSWKPGAGRLARLACVPEDAADRVTYHFSGERLRCLSLGDARIDLLDAAGVIRGALEAVVGPLGVLRFGYDSAGRVTNLTAGPERRLVFENAYDSEGRVLDRRTPDGDWRLTHTDLPGGGSRVEVSAPGNERSVFYYDGQGLLAALGASDQRVILLQYDERGSIAQVAAASVQEPGSQSRAPRFIVGDVIPVPRENDWN